jgi:hypothetical protein
LIGILDAKSEMAMGTPKAVFASVSKMVELLPAADVVEVVRCKDCIHSVQLLDRLMCNRNAHKSENGWFGLRATADKHFCSYGERKEQT